MASDSIAMSLAKLWSVMTSFWCFLDLRGLIVKPNEARMYPCSTPAVMSNGSVSPSGVMTLVLAMVLEYTLNSFDCFWEVRLGAIGFEDSHHLHSVYGVECLLEFYEGDEGWEMDMVRFHSFNDYSHRTIQLLTVSINDELDVNVDSLHPL